MIKPTILLVTTLILSLSTPALAAEPSSGIIKGQIVNGTAGGGSVADQSITLKTYLNDAEKGSATTKTDTEGRFAFAGLVTTDTNYSYDATITFQEADYTSERLSFSNGELNKSTILTVYDSTNSNEAIKVTTAHTIIYIGEGGLEVIEVFSFSNDSDRTYIGSGEITATGTRRTLRLPLPDKMTDLQYYGELMVCCVLPDEESFWDTMPVLPGSKEIAYSYKVDDASGTYTFSRRAYSPTVNYNLLVQGESVAVTSNQLVQQGLVEIEGNQFKQLSGANFASGDVMVAQLSGLPKTGSQGIIIWVVLTLAVLSGGFLLNRSLKKRRLQPVSAKDNLEQTRQELLVELAQLDDNFESGKIPETTYRRLRSEKKSQLVTLMPRPEKNRGNR